MKNIFLILGILIGFNSMSQTTLLNLSTENSPTSSHYIPIGKTGWTSYKKITLTKLNSLEKAERYTADTTGFHIGVGLPLTFIYTASTGTHYLTPTIFSTLKLSQNLLNADKLLDSAIYRLSTSIALFDTGAVSTSVLRKNASNSAAGAYSMAINNTNHSDGAYSFAKGTRAVAIRETSTAISSGKNDVVGDAQSFEYCLKGITYGATADTLRISTVYPTLQTDQFSKFHIELICSIDTGKAGIKIGSGMSQHWDFSAWNDAGSSALVGTADSSTAKRTTAAFTGVVSIEINDATESIYVKVTGKTGYKVNWVAYVRETIVGFRNFTTGH